MLCVHVFAAHLQGTEIVDCTVRSRLSEASLFDSCVSVVGPSDAEIAFCLQMLASSEGDSAAEGSAAETVRKRGAGSYDLTDAPAKRARRADQKPEDYTPFPTRQKAMMTTKRGRPQQRDEEQDVGTPVQDEEGEDFGDGDWGG